MVKRSNLGTAFVYASALAHAGGLGLSVSYHGTGSPFLFLALHAPRAHPSRVLLRNCIPAPVYYFHNSRNACTMKKFLLATMVIVTGGYGGICFLGLLLFRLEPPELQATQVDDIGVGLLLGVASIGLVQFFELPRARIPASH